MLSFYQAVGQQIVKVLEQKGWTRQELANKLGISKQVMSKIINGEKNTTILEIRNIASVLDVPVNKLLSPYKGEIKIDKYKEENELNYQPVFMGDVNTLDAEIGQKRALSIINLILEHKEIHDNNNKILTNMIDLSGLKGRYRGDI